MSRKSVRRRDSADAVWDGESFEQVAASPFDVAGVAADGAQVTALPHAPTHDHLLDAWEEQLNDIKARLSMTTELEFEPVPSRNRPRVRIVSSAQACIANADLLFTTLKQARYRQQQLEHELIDLQVALNQAHANLVNTQVEEQRARHQALHDSLTALPNRSFFCERLKHAIGKAEALQQPLAVMYLDLDGFKPINDKFGHYIGDTLLKIVAARLTRAVRAEDMVSRQGGDEFACLLADFPDREQLIQLAGKLIEAVAAPCQIGKLKLTVRASLGIAMCPADGATAMVLLRRADTAMYAAKRNQSGYAFFDHIANEARIRKHEDGP